MKGNIHIKSICKWRQQENSFYCKGHLGLITCDCHLLHSRWAEYTEYFRIAKLVVGSQYYRTSQSEYHVYSKDIFDKRFDSLFKDDFATFSSRKSYEKIYRTINVSPFIPNTLVWHSHFHQKSKVQWKKIRQQYLKQLFLTKFYEINAF